MSVYGRAALIWLTFEWLDPIAPAAAQVRKQAQAVRVASGLVKLDGRLDESVWQRATAIRDFVQKEPSEGAPPTSAMEVRFLYDDEALYVGARMSGDRPAIQAPMGPRDDADLAEHVFVSLDTYFDRRTAYTFGVTAAGVRLDHYHDRDIEEDNDEGFNPVWNARTSVDDGGWTAELWIPFTQLRYSERGSRIWGLNMFRFVPTRNEEVYWVAVPRTERVWASRFGELHGIEDIPSSRHLELLPYAASATMRGVTTPDNPLDDGQTTAARAGLDLKMGIGSNLTLDATVNPDFGQVEADPAEVNLSAFETFFDERRPFFVEGSALLAGPVNNYFYSRRIGARPSGVATGDYVDYPSTSTILGAAKLTGRLASGMSVGVLGAMTSAETARTFDVGQAAPAPARVAVAPATVYGVARVQQEFGPDVSTAALMFTGVRRALAAGAPLADLLSRQAFSVSGDTLLRFKEGEYEAQAAVGVSHVAGEPPAIARLQRSSARYFQRPDADYVTFDPARTSLTGSKGVFSVSRVGGRHWLWGANASYETPAFETNDIGRLTGSDGVLAEGSLEYRETRPGQLLRNYSIETRIDREWNYGGDLQQSGLEVEGDVTWPNFWSTELSASWDGSAQDMRLTRGGPSMGTPRGWRAGLDIESSPAARTQGQARVEYGRNEDGGLLFEVDTELALQPAPRWRASVNPSYVREVQSQQYLRTVDGGGAATYGRRYVFAFVDRSTYSTQFRLQFTFKPDLDLELYAEPFAASGRHYGFGELAAPRGRALRLYGTDGTTVDVHPNGSRTITDGTARFVLENADFNVLSYRSNLVLRWEWRAGSTLYVVWQQNRETSRADARRVGIADLADSFSAAGTNFLTIKASFWLNVK